MRAGNQSTGRVDGTYSWRALWFFGLCLPVRTMCGRHRRRSNRAIGFASTAPVIASKAGLARPARVQNRVSATRPIAVWPAHGLTRAIDLTYRPTVRGAKGKFPGKRDDHRFGRPRDAGADRRARGPGRRPDHRGAASIQPGCSSGVRL